MTDAYDPGTEGARTDMAGEMAYADYLSLDPILTAQHPRSRAHDEMLFIVQHQTSELWMRLVIHELTAARDLIAAGDLPPAFKMITRVARIFEQLNGAWDVLRTMTPSDYTAFRGHLGVSSGFQSWQYRMIEFLLGNRNPHMLKPHAPRPDVVAALEAELDRPSLYDVALDQLAARFGADRPVPYLRAPHEARSEIRGLWRRVYEDPRANWALYDLAEKLVDLEDYFRRWRFNHVTTVERVIGFKRGTGGTAGVPYLRRMLEVELFPELWQVRGEL
ncbi:tryptophan 2,3-dioxygenase [Rhodobacterales bacterium HKCCE2091]|nr:tryptophan 2,3-dioxygenase [Rhodobacterales bacterium HKCCE2091]